MKLVTLLNKHAEHSLPGELPQILGDSFLLQHNKVYRQVRRQTLDLGFSFSDQFHPDYIAFPMGQLENILSEKVIPFVNNVEVLKSLNQRSSASLEWDHVVDNLKPNYVFHESCHAIARSVTIKSTNLNEHLAVLLIEESFANTCEFFAIADAQDHTHRLFLEVNSYFTVFEDRTHLKKMIEKNGAVSVFKFMLLCYLHSNFLNERLDDQDFKKILALTKLENAPELKVLKTLAENAFALNPRFRYATTEMYLRLNGLDIRVEDALDFDHFALIESNQNLTHFISELSLLIGAHHEH